MSSPYRMLLESQIRSLMEMNGRQRKIIKELRKKVSSLKNERKEEIRAERSKLRTNIWETLKLKAEISKMHRELEAFREYAEQKQVRFLDALSIQVRQAVALAEYNINGTISSSDNTYNETPSLEYIVTLEESLKSILNHLKTNVIDVEAEIVVANHNGRNAHHAPPGNG